MTKKISKKSVKKTSAKKKSTPKKNSPKKKAVKKAAPAKRASQAASDSPHSGLLKTLTDLAKGMDKEGLLFLIQQAEIIHHNMRIIEKSKNRSDKKLEKPISEYMPGGDKKNIEIIESDDGSNFIIVIGLVRNFFSLKEMRHVVKICHAAENKKDASLRLFQWLKKERMDVIRNTPIHGADEPALAIIYNEIISRYI